MKILFIGGTGNISTSVSRMAVAAGHELNLLNRGNSETLIEGAKYITSDIHDETKTAEILRGYHWDCVVDWIAFTPDDIERDFRLFSGKTGQYIFISSASAYQKPPLTPVITETTPLSNPFWEYSRNKIACEEKLNQLNNENGFPVTIVRPSLTYDTVIPVPIGGWKEYTVIDRIKRGKKIIVHGDGTSLWTITHAEDFARGLLGLIGNKEALGEAFHITSDELLTWDQIYASIAEAVGSEPNIIHIASETLAKFKPELYGSLIGDKAYTTIFDNSKIKKFVPGFKAVIPFGEGIKKTIDWFEADPKRMIINEDSNRFIDDVISRYEKL